MKVRKSNIDVLSSNFIENEISMKKLLKELNSYFKLSKLEGNKDKIKLIWLHFNILIKYAILENKQII